MSENQILRNGFNQVSINQHQWKEYTDIIASWNLWGQRHFLDHLVDLLCTVWNILKAQMLRLFVFNWTGNPVSHKANSPFLNNFNYLKSPLKMNWHLLPCNFSNHGSWFWFLGKYRLHSIHFIWHSLGI